MSLSRIDVLRFQVNCPGLGRTRERHNRLVQELREAEQAAQQAARNPKRERGPSPGCEPESTDEDEHERSPRKKARNAGLVRSAPIDAEQTTMAPAPQPADPSLKRKRGDPVIIVPDSSESEPESRPLLRRPGASSLTNPCVGWAHYHGVWAANKDLEAEIKSLQARCDELEAALEAAQKARCIVCLSKGLEDWAHDDGHTHKLCNVCSNQNAEAEATCRA